ncbi:MAG: type IV toxin-antitoxin system AbiEi family antitoxin [Capsulimonas sp.]|uniref:type IV toxin-antitoxin system AbiEi family antitoxin n=1 Tax=Capsulimonas sp. TaxID=2494211 RepID=UPI0032641F01
MLNRENYLREANVISNAASALQDCLLKIAEGGVDYNISPSLSSGARPDIVATFYREHLITVIAEVKKSGEPKFAREAFYQLERYRREIPGAAPAFIAPYISPQTAQLCRDEKIGYMDLAGNCHLSFPGVYIHVEGQANPFAHSRTLKSLYQPKSERVLRVLLHHHPRSWRIQKLADEAQVSTGQVHKVKELLLEKEWVTEGSQGITVSRPKELLHEWGAHYHPEKHRQVLRHTLANLAVFEKDFSHLCRHLNRLSAVTSFAAADYYAPHAAYQRVTAYVSGDLEPLDLALELEHVTSGANIILLAPYDDGVFYGAHDEDGVRIASPVQTYLDLQQAGGRALEAAEILLERVISKQW